MGAGVIPFAVHHQQLYFLFQKVFKGRKTGYLIDFGGGVNEGENHQQAAAREFVEETETMFLAKTTEEIQRAAKKTQRIATQSMLMTQLFKRTLEQSPQYWCRRKPGNKFPPKDWISFFIELDYRDLNIINEQWKHEEGRQTRFSKRRELHWIDVERLLFIYENEPQRLWKRVRQLENAKAMIQMIKREKLQRE